MSDKAITHEDLPHIAAIEKMMDRGGPGVPSGQWNDLVEFVKHLRITAEAAVPPLPEGWVVYTREGGLQQVLYHHGGGMCSTYHAHDYVGRAHYDLSRLTPLRPTITEADVERAVEAYADTLEGPGSGGYAVRRSVAIRAALKAAGIEVEEV